MTNDFDPERLVRDLISRLTPSYWDMTIPMLEDMLAVRTELHDHELVVVAGMKNILDTMPQHSTVGQLPEAKQRELAQLLQTGEKIDHAKMLLAQWEVESGSPGAFGPRPQ